jgi:hypothetical protein
LTAEAVDEVVNQELVRRHYKDLEQSYDTWYKLENSLSQNFTTTRMSPYGKLIVTRLNKIETQYRNAIARKFNPGLPECILTKQDVFVGVPSTEIQLKALRRKLESKKKQGFECRDH